MAAAVNAGDAINQADAVDSDRASGTAETVDTFGAAGAADTPSTADPVDTVARHRRTKSRVALACGLIVTAALLVTSLFVGVYDITAGTDGWLMFNVTRVPRTIALALSGAALAMAGLVMQLLTQNKFVEPTTTGTTEWAGLGLILTMVMVPGATIVQRMIGAILAAFVGTMIFFIFLRRVTLKSSLIVPIVGMMLGAIVGALSSFVALKTDMLQNLGVWFAGSFTGVVRGRYELLWIDLVIAIAVFFLADRLTAAGLGKEIATSIGLNYERILFVGVAMIAVVSGVTTVIVGNLPFVGLIVPNIVSIFRGDNLRTNLPWVAMGGIWVLTICDIIGRTIIMPFEVPISLILGIVGAAIFVVIVVRRNRG